MWKISNVLLTFLLIAFIIAVILALSVITQNDEDLTRLEANRARARILLWISFVLGLLVLVYQGRNC